MADGVTSSQPNTQPDCNEEAVTTDERDIMRKRREYIKRYSPPKWRSSQPDPVSGEILEVPMTSRASIPEMFCVTMYIMPGLLSVKLKFQCYLTRQEIYFDD